MLTSIDHVAKLGGLAGASWLSRRFVDSQFIYFLCEYFIIIPDFVQLNFVAIRKVINITSGIDV